MCRVKIVSRIMLNTLLAIYHRRYNGSFITISSFLVCIGEAYEIHCVNLCLDFIMEGEGGRGTEKEGEGGRRTVNGTFGRVDAT